MRIWLTYRCGMCHWCFWHMWKNIAVYCADIPAEFILSYSFTVMATEVISCIVLHAIEEISRLQWPQLKNWRSDRLWITFNKC
ncbi:hypothetical protein FKM82_021382 [Ascaphus truei]